MNNLQIDWINQMYKINAKIGGKVIYKKKQRGTIKGAKNGYLLIKLDDEKDTKPYHPTWELQILETEDK